MPLALKVPVQRLCTVCLTTGTYFAINLGHFFQSEDSIILCLLVASTLCMCKLCPVVTESSNNSLPSPSSCRATWGWHSEHIESLNFGSTRDESIWDALGPQPPLHRHPSHSSCNSVCNFKCSVTTRGRSQALLQTQEHQAGNNNLSVRLLRKQRVWDLLEKPDKLVPVPAQLTQLALNL